MGDLGTMSRERLNLIVRVGLAVTLGAAFLFTIGAAQPGFIDRGDYPAGVGVAQAIVGVWERPMLWVTVSRPAVVTPPADWNLGQHVCMVVQVGRGDYPAEPVWDDNPPQTRWDQPLADVFIMGWDDIIGTEPGLGEMTITNRQLSAGVTAYLPFEVNWFGSEQFSLYEDQTVGGLLCYQFKGTVDGLDIRQVPPFHSVTFKARNVNIIRRPAYYFRFNSRPSGTDFPGTVTLQEEDFTLYLLRMANEAPFAIRPRG